MRTAIVLYDRKRESREAIAAALGLAVDDEPAAGAGLGGELGRPLLARRRVADPQGVAVELVREYEKRGLT